MVLLAISFIILFLLDIPILIKVIKKRSIFIYFSIMLINFILGYLILTNKEPTSPAILIENIVNYLIRGEIN